MLKKLLIASVFAYSCADLIKTPKYQYRYASEDVLKADASSSFPVGYFPERDFNEYSPDFGVPGRYTGINKGFYGGGYYSPLGSRYIGSRLIGEPIPSLYHHGGEYLDKKLYSEGNKEVDDDLYEKADGIRGESGSHGKQGFNKGVVAVKDSKGDSGYYNTEDAEKKASDDEKEYHGNKHYNEEGKQGGEKKQNNSHKKGHVVKGFKNSHHKDENGKTEEFYDESHDEGGNYNFDGKSGSYGQNSAASYNGGHDNDKVHSIDNKQAGKFDTKHFVDNANADKGEYGQKKFYENGESFGVHNGFDQHSLLGHQEANRVYKNRPFHVPFFPRY